MPLRSPLFLALCLTAAAAEARPKPEGPATADARDAAWQRHAALEAASPFHGLAWRSIGPTVQGGRVVGRSDAIGGVPAERPIEPLKRPSSGSRRPINDARRPINDARRSSSHPRSAIGVSQRPIRDQRSSRGREAASVDPDFPALRENPDR